MDIEGQDIIDVASQLKMESFKELSSVITYGEVGDKFFIVLKGVVRVMIPNKYIQDRALKWNDYQSLL